MKKGPWRLSVTRLRSCAGRASQAFSQGQGTGGCQFGARRSPLSASSSCRLAVLLLCLSGCAPSARSLTPVEQPPAVPARTRSTPAAFAPDGQNSADLENLARLWQRRTSDRLTTDYPLGPGDVLEVSVPAIEELRDRVVRISGEGTIALPFIGVVQASGLTEEGLRAEIHQRLKDYMYEPQVNLFVREYRSRQVAVVGAVEKPGLYSLASGADTLLDMISLAGGLKEEAAPRIHFIPAEPAETGKARELASTLPVQQVSTNSSPLILKGAEPVVIDLKSLTKGGNQIYLSLPARPGDVILVPGSGDVLVEGWVEKPGS